MSEFVVLLATAAEPADAGALGDGAVLAVVGVGVVFAALLLIWGALLAIGRLLPQRAPDISPPTPAPRAAATRAEPVGEDARLIAVLTAAATAAVGRRVRVRQVRRLRRDQNSSWTGHGRIAVHASHRPMRH